MILDLLKKRTSIRNFQSRKVPQEVVNYIIKAGRLSPSGGNEQPWIFGVIDDRNLIEKISAAAYNQKWIASSPLLIVLCTRNVEDKRGARDIQMFRFPTYKQEIEGMDKEIYSCLNAEEHQTKIPGTHMVLAALEYGVAATWVSYFDVFRVQEMLGLPRHCIPSEILVLGYPEEEVKPRAKRPSNEIVFKNKFDKKILREYK